jgi:hypothetical protein
MTMITIRWTVLLFIVALLQAEKGLSEVVKSDVELKQIDEVPDKLLETTTCDGENGQCDAGVECGIWLATSTIPGAGLGMFAGKDFNSGEEMTQSGDIVIPIVDFKFHQKGERYDFLWDEYTWQAETTFSENEGLIEVNSASPGFGAAANSFLDLVNVDEWTPQVGTGLDRRVDPGAGAFSAYHDRKSTAKVDIKAGQELFVSYGDDWFTGREEQLGAVPITGHHLKGQVLITKFKLMKDKAENHNVSHILDEMWETFLMKSPFMDVSRTLNALPSSWEDMNVSQSDGLLAMRKQKHEVTLAWLQEHGTCMDNLRIAPSTIRQAGRGAFATRFLAKDSVVAPMPVIHVPNRRRFIMYSIETSDEGRHYIKDKDNPVSVQLLTNYCMGHINSTMLLCPYGLLTSAVNHNQTLANVRLDWGDPKKTRHHPEWLNMTVENLAKRYSAGLVMTLVATRDIQPGEEIFLDYGDLWEENWNQHVKMWKPAGSYEAAPNADEPNSERFNTDKESIIRTVFEQIEEPYPDSVELKCESAFKYTTKWRKHKKEKDGTFSDFVRKVDEGRAACDVLRWKKGEDGTVSYTAVLLNEDEEEEAGMLKDVPRDAFLFVDKPYKSDMHLVNAFRHEIMIPDEMFPEKWKNAANKEDP